MYIKNKRDKETSDGIFSYAFLTNDAANDSS